ncbi:hypothetical protein QEH59_05170 [Coraliomargarita sp. SDUM461004]|uniref:Uncharacterized protein n=2 Tax=Thalassobacterium sedimentorum TaxID=3041258 RepID=A0ABU1AG50_9BACT|nr:hypothetical protein [Coraliomargarita sp. SDUM461004]
MDGRYQRQNSPISLVTVLWAAITLCAIYSSRPIISGWLHDPSLRWAGIAFIVWLVATLLQWRRLPQTWSTARVLWVLLASALLCLGIMGELQAFIYLASALLLALPVAGLWRKRICFTLTSCVWMPGWAWVFTPILGIWLTYVTLLVPIALLVYSLKVTCLSYASKTSHPSL